MHKYQSRVFSKKVNNTPYEKELKFHLCMKKKILLLLCIPLAMLSCNKDNEIVNNDFDFVTASQFKCIATNILPFTKETYQVKYKNDGIVQIIHTNAVFNACADNIMVAGVVKQDSIIVRENDTNTACNGIKCYNLEYNLSPIKDGRYVLKIGSKESVILNLNKTTDQTFELK